MVMYCLQTTNQCSCISGESTSSCGSLVSGCPLLPILSLLISPCVCVCERETLCTIHKQEITFAYTALHCRSITLYYIKPGFIVSLLKHCLLCSLHARTSFACTHSLCHLSHLLVIHDMSMKKKRLPELKFELTDLVHATFTV